VSASFPSCNRNQDFTYNQPKAHGFQAKYILISFLDTSRGRGMGQPVDEDLRTYTYTITLESGSVGVYSGTRVQDIWAIAGTS
jgi:hypothetical protein